jgi:L-ascorbate metabolism protein UlaG (beta-lactamase superfamily)
MEKRYLKPNLVLEPLFDKWYAWPHLISPATSAMNIVGRHLKIMDSYIEAPKMHQAAARNPKMLGGPFMDFPTLRVDDIIALRETTMTRQAGPVAFARALCELDTLLKENAHGYSLESLYPRVPEILKGYVELHYDLNDRPSFRFFEALLYKSEYYKKSSQSVAFWLTMNDERPFCLSTPRLEEPGILHLDIPFDHPGIDVISKMKKEAGSVDLIGDMLGVAKKDRDLFAGFFTVQAPPKFQQYDGSKARMRYFGHACILIETAGVSILTDPVISYYGYESDVEHFSDFDLPDVIDYVLITHNHQDHILFETLLPLRHRIRNILIPVSSSGALQDPSLKLMFASLGFTKVIGVEEMEEIRFGNITITGIPFTGEHSDLNIRTKLCFHVAIDRFTFLFVADSRVMESRLYEHVRGCIGDVDVLFLGMECDGAPLSWLYGPLLTEKISRDNDQSRRLAGSDFPKGMHLVDIFNPSEVYVYAMGQEPWLQFISSLKYTPESHPIIQSNMLVEECRRRNITAERLFGEKELFYNYEPAVV